MSKLPYICVGALIVFYGSLIFLAIDSPSVSYQEYNNNSIICKTEKPWGINAQPKYTCSEVIQLNERK